MISALGSGMAGIEKAVQRFEKSAEKVASGEADVVKERVEQISAQHDLEANVAVVKTVDEMKGTIIDVLA